MIDYKDLKNGDVIAMIIQEYDEIRIVIVDRVENSATGIHKLYTYAELETSSSTFESTLFLEKDEPGYSYNLYDCVIRYAEDEEKVDLYNAIGKHFTEEYDKDWYKHFTDSSYFDIQDYLLDVFCIKINEYDDDLLIPDFINDIHQFIWDGCRKAMGVSDTDVNKQEKMVSLEKVEEWLTKNFYESYTLNNCGEYDLDKPYIASLFDTINEMFDDLRKTMEE